MSNNNKILFQLTGGCPEKKMIPIEIKAIARVVGAQFYQCILEFLSTNHKDQWILQLQHEKKGNYAFLLNTDNFAALCVGLKQNINAALEQSNHPGTKMMINTIARDLPTSISEGGSIVIISSWEDKPSVEFNFYSNQKDRKSRITLVYMLEDAMSLYNLFATAYNDRENA